MRSHSRFGLGVWLLAIAGFPAPAHGQPAAPPSLGAAASFAVLGGSAVTSSGSTTVTGNLGVSPGDTITGFPPGTVKVGATFRNDSTARQAQSDAAAAYNELAGRTCGTDFSGQDLGGRTLGPGVYCFSSAAQLTGTLILDAANDPKAVWIFKTGSTLTTTPDSSVLVTNGGYESNVFWQVSGAAVISARTAFVGNVLSGTGITLNSGASVSGRLLAQTGAVALDNNNVSLCCDPITLSPATLPKGTVCATYSNTTFLASGGMAPYSFSVPSGALPEGLTLVGGVLSGTPTKKGTSSVPVTATDSRGCSGTRVYVIDVGCPPDDPLSIQLPPAKACQVYCQKITPSCAPGPHVFSVISGALPDGLTLSADGMLCGTPTTPGDYPLVIADGASGCPGRNYTVQVVCNVMISPATLPGATCTRYRETLVASCGTAPYTFTVAAPGTLPAGLSMSSAGVLSGAPTTPGSSTFTVTATDAKFCTASRTYTVVVSPQITISPSILPPGIVCKPYRQPIAATCGTLPYTCTVTSGTPPPGLTLVNCVIHGTPTVAGTFSFTVTVTDATGVSTTQPYVIVVTCPVITISPPVLPPASTCQNYCVKLTPSCAIGSTLFSVTGGAPPPGLTLSPDGMFCGKPTLEGTYDWTVTFTDSVSGCTGSVTYTLVVTGVVITPPTLPGPVVGAPYNEIVTASGGTAPFTFIISGSLPTGLTFLQTTPTTGTIFGTPTANGVFNFCITVTDVNLCTATQCYTMVLAAGGPTLSGWGIVVLSVLLVGAGIVVIRRGGV
ncbi:MAG TPA: IPTL-CTERM sorting domain-containing protein [Thermoanaerobaculia bacterium]|nr:IPTL-CTERM sorting domain-containing protein [Thermoanaerobaculia bacterium]